MILKKTKKGKNMSSLAVASSTEPSTLHPLHQYERVKTRASYCLRQIAYATEIGGTLYETNEPLFKKVFNALCDALTKIPGTADESQSKRKLDTERELVRLQWRIDRKGAPSSLDKVCLLAKCYMPTPYDPVEGKNISGIIPHFESPLQTLSPTPIAKLSEIEIAPHKDPTPLYEHIRTYWLTNKEQIQKIANSLLERKASISFSGKDFPKITEWGAIDSEITTFTTTLENLKELAAKISKIANIFREATHSWARISEETAAGPEITSEATAAKEKNTKAFTNLINLNMQVSPLVEVMTDRLERLKHEIAKAK